MQSRHDEKGRYRCKDNKRDEKVQTKAQNEINKWMNGWSRPTVCACVFVCTFCVLVNRSNGWRQWSERWRQHSIIRSGWNVKLRFQNRIELTETLSLARPLSLSIGHSRLETTHECMHTNQIILLCVRCAVTTFSHLCRSISQSINTSEMKKKRQEEKRSGTGIFRLSC